MVASAIEMSIWETFHRETFHRETFHWKTFHRNVST
jgi:hypothetical protein